MNDSEATAGPNIPFRRSYGPLLMIPVLLGCLIAIIPAKADQQYHPIGQMDLFVEGLKMAEIGLVR